MYLFTYNPEQTFPIQISLDKKGLHLKQDFIKHINIFEWFGEEFFKWTTLCLKIILADQHQEGQHKLQVKQVFRLQFPHLVWLKNLLLMII